MDGRITGGSASFMKRLNKGNYEHEEASATLTFAVNEDATDHATVLGRAAAEAKVAVLVQLGLQPAKVETPAAKPRHAKSATIEKLDGGADPLAAAAVTDGPNATVPQDVKPSNEVSSDDPLAPSAGPGAAASAPTQSSSVSADDPLAAASATPSVTASPAASVVSGGDDPLAPAGAAVVTSATISTAVEDPFTAQREVTDADLGTAVARKNEALIKALGTDGTLKIRDLVGQYCAPGQHVRTIPQAQRQGFLAKLGALA